MKNRTIGLLIFCFILLLIPFAFAEVGDINDTIYLNHGQSNYYHLPLTVGDEVHWSFTTYNDTFEVMLNSGAIGIFSQGKTTDNGILTIGIGDMGDFWVYNWDDTNDGYINIIFE